MQSATRTDYITVGLSGSRGGQRHSSRFGRVGLFDGGGDARPYTTPNLPRFCASASAPGRLYWRHPGESDLRDEYYYYPISSSPVTSATPTSVFVHYPKLIIEVPSDSTERVDKGKFFAYTSVPSLEEYVLVSQAGRKTVFGAAMTGGPRKCRARRPRSRWNRCKSRFSSAIYEGV